MAFGAAETNKGLEQGWGRPDDIEQQWERLESNLRQIEGSLLTQFGWDERESVALTFCHHGGTILDDLNAWVTLPRGQVDLADDQVNFVQRIAATGEVQVNQAGFDDGPDRIPMFQVTTIDGEIDDVIDCRPFVGTATGENGGGGGCSDFPCLVGIILNAQVPLSAVKQWESFLRIAAQQVTSGTFGGQFETPGDYIFPRDLTVVRDAGVLGLLTVLGITTLENQTRRGLRTITAADSPYTLVESDWHLNVDISLGSVEVLIPDAAAHFAGGFTDQLHFKIIGEGFGDPFVTLTPSVPGQLIDGFDSAVLRRNNLSFTLVSDGAGWFIQ